MNLYFTEVTYDMDLIARKPDFVAWKKTKAQTSLCIGTVWSAPLLFTL